MMQILTHLFREFNPGNKIGVMHRILHWKDEQASVKMNSELLDVSS